MPTRTSAHRAGVAVPIQWAGRGARGARATGWLVILASLVCLAGSAVALRAQSPWNATLFITPFPSPYLSDWEVNPTIASFTVVNGGSTTQDVILRYQVTNQAGAVVTTGRSDPQSIPPSAPAVYTDLTEIAGSQEYDPTLEDQVRRSGRMPEGDYTACIAVTDLGGFVLAQACADFTIVYPDPPMLIAPASGDVVTSAAPIFQWTPLQVPPDFTLQYVLQIAEVLPGQVPEAALSSNILHYENLDVGTTNFPYPIDALPLESGKTYAWRVVAMDQNGYAAATNGGSSEIWTFTYNDASEIETRSPIVAPTKLTVQVAKPSLDSLAGTGARIETTLNALCATADQWASGTVDSVLRFSVLAPFFKSDTLTVSVYYAVDSTSVLGPSQEWAFTGESQARNWEYFARGDCDGASDSTGVLGALARLHWIAVRPKQYSFSDYLAQAFGWDRTDTTANHDGIELSFGTGILALRSTTVGDDELFPAEADFFDGNQIAVLPGLNAYGVTWLPEGSVWNWLRRWGWDENKFELQGFVGLANTVSAGVEYEKTMGGEADVTAQQKFLVLTMLLPKRKPTHFDWIRSMRGGLQFSVEDSLTTGVGPGTETKASGDIFLKLLWLWDVNDDVQIEWNGGLDFNAEAQRKLDQSGTKKTDVGTKIDLVLSGQCDCEWKEPFGIPRWWIGDPKLEMHYTIVGDTGMSVAGTFQTGIGDLPPLVAGGSLTWEPSVRGVTPEYQAMKDSVDLAGRKYLDALTAFQKLPEPDMAELQKNQLDDTMDPDERAYVRARRAKDQAQADLKAAEDRLTTAMKANPKAFVVKSIDWKHPEWRIRAAAGNVGIMDLLDIIRGLQ